MKTTIGIADQRSRRPLPLHSGSKQRSLYSAALTPSHSATVLSRPRFNQSRSIDELQSRLAHISAEAFFSPARGPIITGFIIRGSAPKHILLRAAGPTLAEFGLMNWLAYPRIQLFNRSGGRIGENDDPGGEANDIARYTERAGAFPFRPGGHDAALVATLAPGAYTAHISSHSDKACGVTVVEAFEIIDSDEPFESPRFINLSTLADVSLGEGALVARFSVFGKPARRFLIRGVGPGLANYGVIDPIADPQIELRSSSALIAGNDNWEDANRSEMSEISAECGAFPLQPGSRDAALLVTLEPGAYTVFLRSIGGRTGQGLIEVYEVPE